MDIRTDRFEDRAAFDAGVTSRRWFLATSAKIVGGGALLLAAAPVRFAAAQDDADDTADDSADDTANVGLGASGRTETDDTAAVNTEAAAGTAVEVGGTDDDAGDPAVGAATSGQQTTAAQAVAVPRTGSGTAENAASPWAAIAALGAAGAAAVAWLTHRTGQVNESDA